MIIPLNKEEVRQQIEKVVEQNIEVLDEETSTETDQNERLYFIVSRGQ